MKVLFICTHNSARSQMAESYLNHMYGDRHQGFSAGTHPAGLDSRAVEVMTEDGLDVRGQISKSVDAFQDTRFDLAVTLCGKAQRFCPFYAGAGEHLHKPFPEPATFTGSEGEVMDQYRSLRDEIKEWITETFR